ncbi:hypothetical protein ACLM5H_23705 [Fredinandcohnia humi]
MNYMQLLSSLLSGGGGKKLLKVFKRKRNNNGWIWLSILGITILGLIGGRNNRVTQQVQKGFQQAKNSFQSTPERRRNPFDVNYNIATEIAKEIKPDFEAHNQLQKNE